LGKKEKILENIELYLTIKIA